eukprot:TRINITY_DN10014_c0_g1_i1.p1 TRINITY_DN10014_c0_g1~~TRINITY_DN10014_c0_g1_i1.p1  ORF type:complete len:354 (-),score=122.02 TRINITY_DN10014_c0_g1_i1:33-1067(-)
MSEDVSMRYLSGAFNNNGAESTVARMLGIEVNEKTQFCSECACKINGPGYPDPKNHQVVYCKAHYEELAASKCAGCNKAIVGIFTKAQDGTKWHDQCIDQESCCQACHKPIYNESVNNFGSKWHNDCWRCSGCGLKLGSGINGSRTVDGDPYCLSCAADSSCHKKNKIKVDFASKAALEAEKKAKEAQIFGNIQQGKSACGGCGKVIAAYEAVEFNTQLFHEECFKCSSCNKQIEAEQGYAKRGDKAVCAGCARKPAAGCSRCTKPLSGAYLNGPEGQYHKDCFLCALCNGSLKTGFAEKNGKAVCPTCSQKSVQGMTLKPIVSASGRQGGFKIDPRTGQKTYL